MSALRLRLRPATTARAARPLFSGLRVSNAAALSTTPTPPPPPPPTRRAFAAETSKLLHLLSHSLYKNPGVFLRELVSNSSDALEKRRRGVVAGEIEDSEEELRISVTLEGDVIEIRDNGIGMTSEEMESNLGTIARSGTKEFANSVEDGASLIGQFGVGFYSAFVVADSIRVVSKKNGETNEWIANAGDDGYELRSIGDVDDDAVSYTSIFLTLNDSKGEQFKTHDNVKSALKRYSSFVGFPLLLNSELINKHDSAIWRRDDVSTEEYNEFYKSLADDFEGPLMTMRVSVDAPIEFSSLLFVPTSHNEKRGMGRMDHGVHLYSRRVLLSSAEEVRLLPNYLRFVKGIVDSSDLPMSVTRESVLDDSDAAPTLKKMSGALTKKILRKFQDVSNKDPEEYARFYAEFGHFLKEGVSNDFVNQVQIAKLLRYDSSLVDGASKTSLEEYISRMPPWQKHIYYLNVANREAGLSSPYYAAFKTHKVEVIFTYHPLDDFVFGSLSSYEGRDLVSCVEGERVEPRLLGTEDDAGDDASTTAATEKVAKSLGPLKVSSVTMSSRDLGNSPSIVVDHESSGLRKMMAVLQQETGEAVPPLSPQKLQLNRNHALVKILENTEDVEITDRLSKLLLHSALTHAGLLGDEEDAWPNVIALLSKTIK